jgi:hypothetical protein
MNMVKKGLIIALVTSSILLGNPIKSNAAIDVKILAEVAKSCQEDVLDTKYYERMQFYPNSYNIVKGFQTYFRKDELIQSCIYSRYHYSLVLTNYSWLGSTGEILPGYPGSVATGLLADSFADFKTSILDCIANQDISSEECSNTKEKFSVGNSFKNSALIVAYQSYIIRVCPSCVVAHDEVSGSRKEILKAFIQWFMTLEKTQRREIISLLGDEEGSRELRLSLMNESKAAVKKYWEVRQRVEQQEQEQRRQELLGQ